MKKIISFLSSAGWETTRVGKKRGKFVGKTVIKIKIQVSIESLFYLHCFITLFRPIFCKRRFTDLQNREGDRSRGGGGGDFQRSDSSPGSRPSSVLPDLLTSSPGQRQDKSTSEEVRFIRPFIYLCTSCLLHRSSMRALAYASSLSTNTKTFMTRIDVEWKENKVSSVGGNLMCN